MERPQGIVGLALHAARLRWQALTPRGRMFVVAAGTFLTLAVGSAGMHMSACGSHCGGCPSHAAASSGGCPHAHH